MNSGIQFKLQVIAMSGLHSQLDWYYGTMLLLSGALKESEDNTWFQKHIVEALNSVVKCLMNAFRTDDNTAQQVVVSSRVQW
jgi:hypothetical protein